MLHKSTMVWSPKPFSTQSNNRQKNAQNAIDACTAFDDRSLTILRDLHATACSTQNVALKRPDRHTFSEHRRSNF
jgi:hypothetical protein